VASVGARVVLSAEGDRIESARIALGAVGPTAILATAAADALAGQPANADSIARAADIAAQAATPLTDMRGSVAQRIKLSSVLTARALNGALSRALENR
ncbi:MAG TPA: hypothetical protein VFY90_07945, partial [Tepidiformaceae bacterium]|nr:hypothetical protein [Tepidiformaceae bacterium]